MKKLSHQTPFSFTWSLLSSGWRLTGSISPSVLGYSEPVIQVCRPICPWSMAPCPSLTAMSKPSAFNLFRAVFISFCLYLSAFVSSAFCFLVFILCSLLFVAFWLLPPLSGSLLPSFLILHVFSAVFDFVWSRFFSTDNADTCSHRVSTVLSVHTKADFSC